MNYSKPQLRGYSATHVIRGNPPVKLSIHHELPPNEKQMSISAYEADE